MKIAMVSFDSPELRGSQAPVQALSEALTGQGHEVVLYTRCQATVPPSDERDYRVVELPVGPPVELTERDAIGCVGGFAERLGQVLPSSGCEVVHSHCWLAGLATHLVQRTSGMPTVHTFHRGGLLAEAESPPRRHVSGDRLRAERAVALHADRLVATSEVECETLVRVGVRRQRIDLVPPGVSERELHADGHANPTELVEDDGRCRYRLLCFGVPKQLALAMYAVVPLPDVQLVLDLGGPGGASEDDAAKLARLAVRLGMADRVRVRHTDDVGARAALISSAHTVLCMYPVSEQGTVHLEAMACGIPVVAGSAEVAEAVIDGVTGVHALRRDPRRLARQLRELLDDEPLRMGMGIAGRDRARSRYNWARIAAETARIYQRMNMGTASEVS